MRNKISKTIMVIALIAWGAVTNASTMQLQGISLPSDAPAAMDIEGDRAIIGFPSYRADTESPNIGVVALCRGVGQQFDCPTQFTPVTPPPLPPLVGGGDPDAAHIEGFGKSVALAGSMLAISYDVYRDQPRELVRREVAVYENNGSWRKVSIIPGGDGDVALINGNLYVAGTNTINIYREDPKGEWVLADWLIGPKDSGFGATITHQGDVAAIGAPKEPHSGLSSAGAVYLYRILAGKLVKVGRVESPEPAQGQLFGRAISMPDSGGQYLFIAAPGNGAMPGAVYAYQVGKADTGKVVLSDAYTIRPDNGAQPLRFGIAMVSGQNKILIGSTGITGTLDDGSLTLYQLEEAAEWFAGYTFSPSAGEWAKAPPKDLVSGQDETAVAFTAIAAGAPPSEIPTDDVSDDGVSGENSGEQGGGALGWITIMGVGILRRRRSR